MLQAALDNCPREKDRISLLLQENAVHRTTGQICRLPVFHSHSCNSSALTNLQQHLDSHLEDKVEEDGKRSADGEVPDGRHGCSRAQSKCQNFTGCSRCDGGPCLGQRTPHCLLQPRPARPPLFEHGCRQDEYVIHPYGQHQEGHDLRPHAMLGSLVIKALKTLLPPPAPAHVC